MHGIKLACLLSAAFATTVESSKKIWFVGDSNVLGQYGYTSRARFYQKCLQWGWGDYQLVGTDWREHVESNPSFQPEVTAIKNTLGPNNLKHNGRTGSSFGSWLGTESDPLSARYALQQLKNQGNIPNYVFLMAGGVDIPNDGDATRTFAKINQLVGEIKSWYDLRTGDIEDFDYEIYVATPLPFNKYFGNVGYSFDLPACYDLAREVADLMKARHASGGYGTNVTVVDMNYFIDFHAHVSNTYFLLPAEFTGNKPAYHSNQMYRSNYPWSSVLDNGRHFNRNGYSMMGTQWFVAIGGYIPD